MKPSHAQLQRVSAELLVAAQDRQPLVHWPGVELRRFDGRIYAMPPLKKWDASRRYRICFSWGEFGPTDVEITDYLKGEIDADSNRSRANSSGKDVTGGVSTANEHHST
ncbi:MAG: TilS substrate-binding domain-containing protein [Gammaproteobacteria bacterium]|nr:TilS substrate-binding domain-containing protein [Gammaproteobacteria bacterium]